MNGATLRHLLGIVLVCTVLWADLCRAQFPSESRTALVIGVGNYADRYFGTLTAPEGDARSIAESLKALGFEVTLKLNATRREMLEATDVFRETLARKQGVGLFYFSGHGSIKPDEADPKFLIPAGTSVSSREDLPQEAFNAQRVANRMKDAGNRLNLIFLDACRNNTLPSRAKDATGGLAAMRGATGLMFFFATQPHQVALEDSVNRRSLFTSALLKHLRTPGLSFMDMMADVTAETEKMSLEDGTGFKQSPFMSGTLSGRFAFIPGSAVAPAMTETDIQRRVDEELARRQAAASVTATPSQDPAAVVRQYLQNVVAQDWTATAPMLAPESLSRRHARMVTAVEGATSASDQAAKLALLGVRTVQELKQITPQAAYVADRSAVHARMKLSPETVKRKQGTLKINILGAFTEGAGRIAHVVARTDQSTLDSRIEELLIISLRAAGKGGWLIVPDMQTPETQPLPGGRSLFTSVEALSRNASDSTGIRVQEYLRAVVSKQWTVASKMLLPASLERRKQQMVDAIVKSSTMSEEAAKLAQLGLKDIKQLETTPAATAYVLDREAVHRRTPISPSDDARKVASVQVGIIGTAEEDGGRMRHALVRTCQETTTNVIAELLVISLARDASSGTWYIVPDAQQPITTPLK